MSGAGARNRRAIFDERGELTGAPVAPDPLADDPLANPGGDALGSSWRWIERFPRWISLKPSRSLDESEQAHAIVATGRFDLEVPYDPETTAIAPETWRMRLGDDAYDIRSVEDPDGTRRTIHMRLEKGGAT